MKRGHPIPLLLVLLAVSVLPSRVVSGELHWRVPVSDFQRFKNPGVGILPSPLLTDQELRSCLSPLQRESGCVYSVFDARRSKVHVGPRCCSAFRKLTDRCVGKIFSVAPLTLELSPVVKGYCDSLSPGDQWLIPVPQN